MADDGTSIDLALATEDELIDELGKRSNGVVVVLSRDTPGDADAGKETLGVSWRGGVAQALGLASHGLWYVRRYMRDRKNSSEK